MNTVKIAVSIDRKLVSRLDQLVAAARFPNRSHAVQEAVRDKLDRMEKTRLARECAKLDPGTEQEFADEGLEDDFDQWPEWSTDLTRLLADNTPRQVH